MFQTFANVLSEDQLRSVVNRPEVAQALAEIESGRRVVYFSIPLSADIKETLRALLGLDLTAVEAIPMRWIKGDIAPHVDTGAGAFSNTYLMYLTSNDGSFRIGDATYPIVENNAFIFNEGLSHETINTGSEPRLLLGPMSEAGIPVGGANIIYYPTQSDALANTNPLGYNINSFVVGNVDSGTNGGFTSWRIASNSNGPANQALVYNNGTTLSGTQFVNYYFLYPTIPCFLEGSKVLCLVDGKEDYVPVENLRKGTLVKTSRDGYKKVELVAKGEIVNPGTDERTEGRLYICRKEVYPDLEEDLILTGCHSLLVSELTPEQREKTIKSLGRIFVTDGKYRLMAAIDERAEPWLNEGKHTIWHFALENADENMNYGVFAKGGLLVETCSLKFIKTKANMSLVE